MFQHSLKQRYFCQAVLKQGNHYYLQQIINNFIIHMNKTKKVKNSQIPLFIEKLIEMLDDEEAHDVISWTDTEDSFVIKNVPAFTENVLPKYFKHRNYSSFIRQLNMYAFNKIRHEEGQNVYMNENFKKNNKGLLKNIKRKVNQQKQDKIVLYNGATKPTTKQIQQLKTKQRDLETVCRHLITQNQKLLTQNNNLMKKMKQQSRQKDSKLQQLLLTLIMAKNQNNKQIGNGDTQNGMLCLTGPFQSEDASTPYQQSEEKQMNNYDQNKVNQQNNNMKKFHQMLNFLYKGNGKKQKSNNYTIVNGNQNENGKTNSHEQKFFEEDLGLDPIEVKEEDNKDQSVLSINDFLNMDQNIDMKNGRKQ